MIYLSRPSIDRREIEAAARVLRSGWLSSGSEVREFENKFAKFIGVKYAVSLNSCASALQLAIQALGLKGEVILPSFTFPASANAVIHAGCIPRFVDIEYGTCNMNPLRIEALINSKTVAIMPVHFAGQSCDMAGITAVAKKHRLAVIEDSAEAIGATFRGKKTGAFGTGCFSFFSTKNMTCGEGGMVTTNDKKTRDKILAYSSHGIERGGAFKKQKPWFREAKYPGFNYRMPNLLAAVAAVQLSKLEGMNNARRERAYYLNKNLKECEEIDLPVEDPRCRHVYQMYAIKIKPGGKVNRDAFVAALRKQGVEASVHFVPPLHRQGLYKKYCYAHDKLPVTEKVCSNIVTLPLYPSLTRKKLNVVVSNMKKNLKRGGIKN